MNIIKKIPNNDKFILRSKNKKRIIYRPNELEKIKYQKVKEDIEKKYNISVKNRDIYIKQIIHLLTQGTNLQIQKRIPFTVIRSDIQDFFPSINKHRLHKLLKSNNYLSNESQEVLNEFMFNYKVKGIPQGIPFTSALAEFYLRDFDEEVKMQFKPQLYQRYVDDIILIIYPDFRLMEENYHINSLNKIAKNHSLTINQGKTTLVKYTSPISQFKFEYLGYEFKIDESKLTISISEEKYKKIWDKIYRCFSNYRDSIKSNSDYWILFYKLRNILHGITSRNSKNELLKFGMAYSYRYINDSEQIKKLINQFKYQIHLCNLSSNKRVSLMNLAPLEQNGLDLLHKKFDYTKLTNKQLTKMHNRINSVGNKSSVESFFYHLYK